jgi:MFS family permease
MLGLFLVLPVFMVLATEVPGYTPVLAGIAIGIYGLTQAALQQPFGWLSDRWGRRRVILLGLALFSAGGVVAALAPSMGWLIAGRALQGCGAIAGVTLALAADRTRAEKRSLVMAMIGMGIGASFLLSIMVSVPLAGLVGLRGMFWFTAALGVVGMLLLLQIAPGPTPERRDVLREPAPLGGIWTLAWSVFLLHALLTLFFVVLPVALVDVFGLALRRHWLVYVPTMVAAVLIAFPFLRWLGARQLEMAALPWSFLVLGASMGAFTLILPLGVLAVAVTLFFVAFNALEATMPSLVSRLAGVRGRGRKMGIYTTFQFLGAFTGGAVGGWLVQTLGNTAALAAAAGAAVLWAVALKYAGSEPAAGI